MSVRYLQIFWKSPVLPLINCKVELKLKWINHCVLTVLGNKNDDADYNVIINRKHLYDQPTDSDFSYMKKQVDLSRQKKNKMLIQKQFSKKK